MRMSTVENRMKKNYSGIGVTFSPDGPGKQRITDKFGLVGTVTDNYDKGERRYSYDGHVMGRHLVQVKGSDKTKAKADKRDDRKKNRKDQDFILYRIDEKGNYSPEDFVMSQVAVSYDNEAEKSHTNNVMQVFTVERAYVTKDELKQIKKDNKMKMTYQNIIQFERGHHIPAIPADLQKHINEIVK